MRQLLRPRHGELCADRCLGGIPLLCCAKNAVVWSTFEGSSLQNLFLYGFWFWHHRARRPVCSDRSYRRRTDHGKAGADGRERNQNPGLESHGSLGCSRKQERLNAFESVGRTLLGTKQASPAHRARVLSCHVYSTFWR